MTKRENEYGIKSLIMCPFVTIVHPATQAKLQLKAVIEFFPGDFLPEFTEVQNTIRQKMENQKMQIEAATDRFVEIFNEYGPNELKVRVDVINNNTFFSVSATAECCNLDQSKEEESENGQETPEIGKKGQGKRTGRGPKPKNDDEDDDEE